MAVGAHTVAMTSISGSLLRTAMRSSLLGAHAQDPVVPDGRSIPDRPWRVGRRHDGPAPMLDAPSGTRMTLVDGDPTVAGARAEERRAA